MPLRCPSRSGSVLDDASVDRAGGPKAPIFRCESASGDRTTGMARCGPRSLRLMQGDYDYPTPAESDVRHYRLVHYPARAMGLDPMESPDPPVNRLASTQVAWACRGGSLERAMAKVRMGHHGHRVA